MILAVVLILFPLIALCCDNRDYKIITRAFDEKEEDEEFIRKIAVAKGEEFEEVQY